MSDKYQSAIARYETARQMVSKLRMQRTDLIKECESIETIDSTHGRIETGTLCLNSVYSEMIEDNRENFPDGYSYEETMENAHDEERCCDACYKSYEIKTGPLAAARKEFGNAKRALSYIGKKLIKDAT